MCVYIITVSFVIKTHLCWYLINLDNVIFCVSVEIINLQDKFLSQAELLYSLN